MIAPSPLWYAQKSGSRQVVDQLNPHNGEESAERKGIRATQGNGETEPHEVQQFAHVRGKLARACHRQSSVKLGEAVGQHVANPNPEVTRGSVASRTEEAVRSDYLADNDERVVTIGRERCRQILVDHDITFRRTETWKESRSRSRRDCCSGRVAFGYQHGDGDQ